MLILCLRVHRLIITIITIIISIQKLQVHTAYDTYSLRIFFLLYIIFLEIGDAEGMVQIQPIFECVSKGNSSPRIYL